MKSIFYTLTFLLAFASAYGQADTIRLRKPSFEQPPQGGEKNSQSSIKGWFDCGVKNFPNDTPPDIHPKNFWGNTKQAKIGKTYLGMVVRDDESWEAVSQRLNSSLIAGECYSFSVYLSKSERYISGSKIKGDKRAIYNYDNPAVLRIWGGTGYCGTNQLLGESAQIKHSDWQRYDFKLKPTSNYKYIMLEAFYKTPVTIPYNGHILVDGLSEIIKIDCEAPEPEIAKVEKPAIPAHKRKKKKTVKKEATKEKVEEVVANQPKSKILKKLDRTKITEGQTIEIEKLYFKADTSSINHDSYEVLDEVYAFLNDHADVIIEIGGHTNDIPSHKYCDNLSKLRAKAVAEYLVGKGIPASRLQYKGYGKRKPIANNRTKGGRKKNQRVEIKILSLG